MLDILKQNIILYYADYLAISKANRQVTDNCKYYCIYDAPINLAYLHDSQPFYSVEDEYYIKAYDEITLLLEKVGLEGTKSFVNNICNLKAMGCVDALLMLKQIHQFSSNIERNTAFKDYQRWLNTQHYSHLQLNDKEELERVECTRYIAHSDYNTRFEPQVEYIKVNYRYKYVEKRIQSYTGTRTETKKI